MSEETPDLARFLLELADAADDGGFLAEADAIAAVLPDLKMLKAAQYEGFQHYWMMNGRAFERAWMLKRRQKPTMSGTPEQERKSAHETWFEVLEEYQASLEGQQAGFLAQYASTEAITKAAAWPWPKNPAAPPAPKPKGPTLSPTDLAQHQEYEQWNRSKAKQNKKKENDEGPDAQDSWRGVKPDSKAEGSSPEMGPGQEKLHKEIEDKSKDDGESEGEEWSKWLDEAEAGNHLMRMVTAKIDSGEEPGVAIYESINEMSSGREATAILAKVSKAVEASIKAVAAKDSKQAQVLQNAWEQLKGAPGAMWGAAADAAGFSGPGMLNQINTQHQIAINNMKAIWSSAKSGAPINPVQIQQATEGLAKAVARVAAEMKQAGMPQPPTFPDINSYSRNMGNGAGVTGPDIQRWATDVDRVLKVVSNPAVMTTIRRSKGVTKGQPAPAGASAIEDQYLDGELNAVIGNLGLPTGIVQSIVGAMKPLMDQHIRQITSRGGDEMAINMAVRALSNVAAVEINKAVAGGLPSGYRNKAQFDESRNRALANLGQVLKEVLQRKAQAYTP